MNEAELNLERMLSIWWSFAWRAALLSMVVGAILGGIGGFIFAAYGNPQMSGSVGALLGWLGSIPVSIWALKAALSKKHGATGSRYSMTPNPSLKRSANGGTSGPPARFANSPSVRLGRPAVVVRSARTVSAFQGVSIMKRSSLPMYCPYCNGTNVAYKGHDASTQGRAKNRIVYECQDGACARTFTDETLRRHEAAQRMND